MYSVRFLTRFELQSLYGGKTAQFLGSFFPQNGNAVLKGLPGMTQSWASFKKNRTGNPIN